MLNTLMYNVGRFNETHYIIDALRFRRFHAFSAFNFSLFGRGKFRKWRTWPAPLRKKCFRRVHFDVAFNLGFTFALELITNPLFALLEKQTQ